MSKSGKGKNPNPKKGKTLVKLLEKSDSDTDDSEHELSYYLNDRVKLMKEVMKIIRPKKIRSMAPEWMRRLDIKEINSMLLEELLGISNKRLKGIFNGQTKEEDSSSTDPELEEHKHADIISLDDVSEDDFVINLDSDDDSRSKRKKTEKVKVKEESRKKRVKREKHDKSAKKSKDPDKEKSDEQNLMSVLELLELQARARAIKSQLALENQKKAEMAGPSKAPIEESDNEDAVIIESPKNIEIVITSSESENEESKKKSPKAGTSKSTSKETDRNKSPSKNVGTEQSKDKVVEDVVDKTATNSSSSEQGKDKVVEDIVDKTATNSIEVNENERNNDSEKEKEVLSESSNVAVNVSNLCIEEGIRDTTESRENWNHAVPQSNKSPNKIQIHNISILTLNNEECGSSNLSNSNESNREEKPCDNEENVQEVIECNKTAACKNENSSTNEDLPIEETTNQVNVLTEVESTANERQIKSLPKKSKSYRKRRTSSDGESESSRPVGSSEQQPKQLSEIQEGTGESVINPEENEGIIINVDQSEIECISDSP